MSFIDHYANETPLGPSLDTIKARARVAFGKRCACGPKRDEEPAVHKSGSRTWTTCRRCFGTVRQMS